MKPQSDELQARIIEHCQELIDRIKTLRDYATTPGNTWLARNELARINQLAERHSSSSRKSNKPIKLELDLPRIRSAARPEFRVNQHRI